MKGKQAQPREVPVHEHTSDLGHSLQGVGVHGTGRSIGLSGYSLPGPDVLAESGNSIPGPNADELISKILDSEDFVIFDVVAQFLLGNVNVDVGSSCS